MRSAGVDTERGRPGSASASTEAAGCFFVCGDAKASVGVCVCVFSVSAAAQRRRMKERVFECGRLWFCVVVLSVWLFEGADVDADSSSASTVRDAVETESGRLDPWDERRRMFLQACGREVEKFWRFVQW